MGKKEWLLKLGENESCKRGWFFIVGRAECVRTSWLLKLGENGSVVIAKNQDYESLPDFHF